MNGRRFGALQQLMVAVEIYPVGVAARADRATIRVRFGNNGQSEIGQPVLNLVGRQGEKSLQRSTGGALVTMLSGEDQDLERGIGAAILETRDGALPRGPADDRPPNCTWPRRKRRKTWRT